MTSGRVCAIISRQRLADVAQWQSVRFPSRTRGFDSRHLLQKERAPFRGSLFLGRCASPSRGRRTRGRVRILRACPTGARSRSARVKIFALCAKFPFSTRALSFWADARARRVAEGHAGGFSSSPQSADSLLIGGKAKFPQFPLSRVPRRLPLRGSLFTRRFSFLRRYIPSLRQIPPLRVGGHSLSVPFLVHRFRYTLLGR